MTPDEGAAPARITPLGSPLTAQEARRIVSALEANIARALKGKQEIVERALASLAAGGHLLLEDVPGLGQTTLAPALARPLGLATARIQGTSDPLPGGLARAPVHAPAPS